MNPPPNQPASLHARPCITDDYSLEVTVRDVASLAQVTKVLPPSMQIAIPFLPTDDKAARVAAIRTVHQLGFEPMPHFAARRITSVSGFDDFMIETVAGGGIKRCFVVAGDPPHSLGPFPDSTSLIATGAFERCGVETIGIGGHPEGHPVMSEAECWAVATLMRFAAQCGVGTSTAILAKYGISATRLLGTSGPERFVNRLAAGLTSGHGPVRLHFYPFGNMGKTVDWISHYASSR